MAGPISQELLGGPPLPLAGLGGQIEEVGAKAFHPAPDQIRSPAADRQEEGDATSLAQQTPIQLPETGFELTPAVERDQVSLRRHGYDRLAIFPDQGREGLQSLRRLELIRLEAPEDDVRSVIPQGPDLLHTIGRPQSSDQRGRQDLIVPEHLGEPGRVNKAGIRTHAEPLEAPDRFQDRRPVVLAKLAGSVSRSLLLVAPA